MQQEHTDEKTRPRAGCLGAGGSFTLNFAGCCEVSALACFHRCSLITVVSASEGMISLELFRWSGDDASLCLLPHPVSIGLMWCAGC